MERQQLQPHYVQHGGVGPIDWSACPCSSVSSRVSAAQQASCSCQDSSDDICVRRLTSLQLNKPAASRRQAWPALTGLHVMPLLGSAADCSSHSRQGRPHTFTCLQLLLAFMLSLCRASL